MNVLFTLIGGIIGAALIFLWASIRKAKSHAPTQQMCACEHESNYHARKGKGKCKRSFGISEKFPQGSHCACKFFCLPRPPELDKSAQELEKMVGLSESREGGSDER